MKKTVKTKLRRNDTVMVMAGKEIGRTGRILSIDHEKNKAIVEGLNMQTKHMKPNRSNQTGGISKREAPIHLSNIMYFHKDKPTRLGYKPSETTIVDGKKRTIKKRYAKSTGEVID